MHVSEANKLNTSTEPMLPLTVCGCGACDWCRAKGLPPRLNVCKLLWGLSSVTNKNDTTLTQARTLAQLIACYLGKAKPTEAYALLSRDELIALAIQLKAEQFAEPMLKLLCSAYLALPLADCEPDYFASTVLNELLYELESPWHKPTVGLGAVPIAQQARNAKLFAWLADSVDRAKLVPDTLAKYGSDAISYALACM